MGALIERLSNKIVKAKEGNEQMTISYNAEIQQFIVSIFIYIYILHLTQLADISKPHHKYKLLRKHVFNVFFFCEIRLKRSQ